MLEVGGGDRAGQGGVTGGVVGARMLTLAGHLLDSGWRE